MPVSPTSRIPATSLPNITSLREGLDYGNSHLTRCNVFYDDVRGFRKKFHTSTGLPGPDLHNWKLKEHQAGLDEMTAAYLDRDGNGPLYWPDSSSSANFNKLHYSKDRTRYKNKDKMKSPEPEPQPRGRSSDDPIDVDALPLSPRDGPGINLDDPQRPSKNTPAANVVKAASSSKRGAKVKVENPDSGDIYEFQETPEPEQSTVRKEDYVPSGDPDEFLQRLNSEETPATSSDAPRRPEVLLKDDSLWIHQENRREELVTKTEQLEQRRNSIGAKLDHITPGQRPSNFPLEFNQTNAKANTDARPQGKVLMAAMETTEGLRQESEKPDAPRPRALPKPVIEFI
ncbi:hypothetical protein SCUP234_04697 [Seiridium cupressi]